MTQIYKPYLERMNGAYTVCSLPNDKESYRGGLNFWFNDSYVNAVAAMLYKRPCRVAWVGNQASFGNETARIRTIFNRTFSYGCEFDVVDKPLDISRKYLVNHSRRQYLNLFSYWESRSEEGRIVIHPLPLLTEIGNTISKDYVGEDYRSVGKWCLDIIAIEKKAPIGYKEVTFNFCNSYKCNIELAYKYTPTVLSCSFI